jgi:hypothetical protein
MKFTPGKILVFENKDMYKVSHIDIESNMVYLEHSDGNAKPYLGLEQAEPLDEWRPATTDEVRIYKEGQRVTSKDAIIEGLSDGDIVVCNRGFKGGSGKARDPLYGGAGYMDGMMAIIKAGNRNENNDPEFVHWGEDGHKFNDSCGVFARALRKATDDEVNMYNAGVRNVYNVGNSVVTDDLIGNVEPKVLELLTDDMLLFAEKYYPVGTDVISAYSGNDFTIRSSKFKYDEDGDIVEATGHAIIFRKSTNKWSTILSKPGDKVELISGTVMYDNPGEKHGTSYTATSMTRIVKERLMIIDPDTGKNMHLVQLEGDNTVWFKQLDLLTEKTITEALTEFAPKKSLTSRYAITSIGTEPTNQKFFWNAGFEKATIVQSMVFPIIEPIYKIEKGSYKVSYLSTDGTNKKETVEARSDAEAIGLIKDLQTLHYVMGG